MPHPLHSAYLKLARAYEHLQQLDTAVSAFVDSKPYAPRPHFDFSADEHTMRVHVLAEPPAHLGVLAGDIVHNVRAALDHLVFALSDPAKRCQKTQFPIFDDPAKFDRHVDAYLCGVDDTHRAVIKSIQPDGKRYGLLMDLAQLDDRNKHRVLDPIAAAAMRATLTSDPPDAITGIRLPPDMVYLEEGAVLLWFTAATQVPVNYDLEYTMFFGRKEGPKIRFEDMGRIVALGQTIVAWFADPSEFPAHNAPPES